jgi:hypothetical protein
MYKSAYKYDEDIIFYFDEWGSKYVASGGTLAWRIKNPGLIHNRSQAASLNNSIGTYKGLAIFAEPEQGFKALSNWLLSNTIQNKNLEDIARHYSPGNAHNFLHYLSSFPTKSHKLKIKTFSKAKIEEIKNAICEFCEYKLIGNENFARLPKILAKIENAQQEEEAYWIEGNTILSKADALQAVLRHQLDAVIVRDQKNVHLRSRPHHCMQHINLTTQDLWFFEGNIDVLCRSVGQKRIGQCIWGFINGIANTRENALESAELISKATYDELVLSMPNDQILWGLGNFIACVTKKMSFDTPVVDLAVKFFRYLLKLSEEDPKNPPVVVFVHSQGAIIAEHAIQHLTSAERKKLRLFTFGGGSFIPPDTCHPDSHNFASEKDWVPRLKPYVFQEVCHYYHLYKQKGKTDEEVIEIFAMRDSLIGNIKSEKWMKERRKFYEEILKMMSNVTILEAKNWIEHSFNNECYQEALQNTIDKCNKLISQSTERIGNG